MLTIKFTRKAADIFCSLNLASLFHVQKLRGRNIDGMKRSKRSFYTARLSSVSSSQDTDTVVLRAKLKKMIFLDP